jgi:hypothetical protein
MAAQQPNFNAISQHLVVLAGEVALIPNIPAMDIQDQLHQIIAAIQVMQQQIGNMQQQIEDLGKDRNLLLYHLLTQIITCRQDLLPIRLWNAIASLDAPLCYPVHIVPPAQAPQTKQELLTLTGMYFNYTLFLLSNI